MIFHRGQWDNLAGRIRRKIVKLNSLLFPSFPDIFPLSFPVTCYSRRRYCYLVVWMENGNGIIPMTYCSFFYVSDNYDKGGLTVFVASDDL